MERRLTKLAIAVRLHEQRFGEWPQSIPNLEKLDIGLGPIDPIVERALRYRASSNQSNGANERSEKAITMGV
ncbi:hypothetical protein [Rubripirellula reticaptiva]|uniref:hypothetical protein n=1 Tax=Rubripirellula reticaptiva TaxID=2528013 RepID=UPI0011B83C60|nr:hypothetical protein [Rubripirellula reticaptiva]